ncbi:hypothetical protein SAMN05660649_00066 [Desulfotomaculum arcticum]|uniref:Uncharacterized protein n=1 Tax=Desulfotruncus arcticus DSM 17038 TaxID=1121424 RepID=A0A1I2MPA8_9FIRM|nr:hypothetical protein [Desulfotruncus arcticus]SFF93282.1 hypothetical protein SAMN05660649_00066 [Desulfotomaculum arcticum] [Desulfotruncus arcticus DSM 17038]
MVLIGVAISVNGVPIRLTDERWKHIVIGHPELKDLFTEVINTIREPLSVRLGNNDELLAVQRIGGRYIHRGSLSGDQYKGWFYNYCFYYKEN